MSCNRDECVRYFYHEASGLSSAFRSGTFYHLLSVAFRWDLDQASCWISRSVLENISYLSHSKGAYHEIRMCITCSVCFHREIRIRWLNLLFPRNVNREHTDWGREEMGRRCVVYLYPPLLVEVNKVHSLQCVLVALRFVWASRSFALCKVRLKGNKDNWCERSTTGEVEMSWYLLN